LAYSNLRPVTLFMSQKQSIKFILTNELGRLAKWLRMLGFDSVYARQVSRSQLIITSLRDERIILTRDSRMSPVSGIRLLKIRYDNILEQVQQVLKELGTQPDKNMLFTRCIICNEELKKAHKEEIKEKVPEYVYNTQNIFVACPKCGRIYWHGTHWDSVEKLMAAIRV